MPQKKKCCFLDVWDGFMWQRLKGEKAREECGKIVRKLNNDDCLTCQWLAEPKICAETLYFGNFWMSS